MRLRTLTLFIAMPAIAVFAMSSPPTVTGLYVGGRGGAVSIGTNYFQPRSAVRIGSDGGQVPRTPYTVTGVGNRTGRMMLGAGMAAEGAHFQQGRPCACVQPPEMSSSFDDFQPDALTVAPPPRGGTVTGTTTLSTPGTFGSTVNANSVQANTVAAGATSSNDTISKNTAFVDARSVPWNVVSSSTVDQSAGINAAIAHAEANGYMIVRLPAGPILLNSALNLTNTAGITLEGSGSTSAGTTNTTAQTKLICNMTSVCVDMDGSNHVTLKNFWLTQGTNTPRVGILMGRNDASSGTRYAEFNDLENLFIDFWQSVPSATPRGVIGVYDVGAESATFQRVDVYADAPFVLADTNYLHIASPYQSTFGQSGIESMAGTVFIDCWSNGLNPNAAGFLEEDGHVTQNTLLLGTGSTAASGGSTVPIILRDDANSLRILGGQWEDYASFLTIYGNALGETDSLSIDTNVVGAVGTGGLINLYGTSPYYIPWSNVRIKEYPSSTNPLFGHVDTGADWRGGTLDIGSTSGINSANLHLHLVDVEAGGLPSSAISVASGSSYFLTSNGGAQFVGGLSADTLNTTGRASFTTGFKVGGEEVDYAPRMQWSSFIYSSWVGVTKTWNQTHVDHPIAITHVVAVINGATVSGCSVQPELKVGGYSLAIPNSRAIVDSGPISQAVAAGALTLSSTAGTGCTGGDQMSVSVEYMMQ